MGIASLQEETPERSAVHSLSLCLLVSLFLSVSPSPRLLRACTEEKPGEDTARSGHLQARKRALFRNQIGQNLRRGLSSLQNCEHINFYGVSPQDFIMAAQTNTDTYSSFTDKK